MHGEEGKSKLYLELVARHKETQHDLKLSKSTQERESIY